MEMTYLRHKIPIKLLIFLFAIILSKTGFALSVDDSLHYRLALTNDDSAKVMLNLKLGESFQQVNIDSSFYYTDKAYEICKIKELEGILPIVYIHYGYNYFYKNDLDEANVKFNRALDIYSKIGDEIGKANCYNNIGVVYQHKGELSETLSYFDRALDIYEESGDSLRMTYCYTNIGIVYNDLARYNDALEYCYKSLRVSQKIKNKDRQASAYMTIALIYSTQKKSQKAIVFNEKAFNIYTETKNKKGIIRATENLINIYLDFDRLSKAEILLNDLEHIYLNANFKPGLIQVYESYAICAEKKEAYTDALDYLFQSMKLAQEIDNLRAIAELSIKMGGLYHKIGKTDKAQAMLYEGIELAEQFGLLGYLSDGYYTLAKIFYAKEQYKQATEYINKYKESKVEIRKNSEDNNITELLTKLDYEEAQHELKIVQAEKELNNVRSQSQKKFKYVLLITSIIPLALIIMILLQYFFRKKYQLEIAEKISRIQEQKHEILTLKEEAELQNIKKQNQCKKIKEINYDLEKYTFAIKKVSTPIILANKDGDIEWVNNGFVKIYGHDLDALVKSNNHKLIPFIENDEITSKIDYLKANKKSVVYTSPFRNGDETMWIQTTLTPILNKRGELVNIAAFQINITQLKQNLDLTKQVKDGDGFEINNTFLTNINHEIRTPLNAIVGFASLLSESTENKQILSEIESILESSDVLLLYMNDIITLSRRDREADEVIEVELRKFADKSFGVFKEYFLAKNIKFEIIYTKVLPAVVYADEIRIRQLILCVLANSLKYTNAGNVVLGFDLETSKASLHNKLKITIEDTGIGMSSTKIRRFNEALAEAKNIPEFGTGFSVVKKLAKELNANINIESKKKSGIKVIISIEVGVKKTNLINQNTDSLVELDELEMQKGDLYADIIKEVYNLNAEDIPEETLVNLVDIVEILHDEYVNDFNNIVKTRKVTDIMEFSKKIAGFGETHNLLLLMKIGRQLNEDSRSFNILKINLLMELFPIMVEKLGRIAKT